MKNILSVLLVVFLSMSQGWALIGASKQSCDKAYGKPVKTFKKGSLEYILYKGKGELMLCMFIYKDHCVGASISGIGDENELAKIVALYLQLDEQPSDLKKWKALPRGKFILKPPAGGL